jgi:asparagine synthetase B (glutamine-hydrolysing)
MVQKRLGSYDVKDNETDIAAIRKGLEEAVHRQMMSDVPYGVLLSGGLDSSIISAVAAKYARKELKVETNKKLGILDCTVLQLV